jgi:diacylglycerol kinase (ATP)
MDPSVRTAHDLKGKRGIPRLIYALRNSVAGFRHAIVNEDAIRQELIALAIGVPVAVFLPVGALARLILVLSMMILLLVELLNTAIENTVDRIGFEHHPLAGNAKDLGSAAVVIALVMCGLSWVVIAGPVVVGWLRR